MKKLFFILCTFSASLLAAPVDSLSIAAEYYYSRHDYRQSLALWGEVYRRQPESSAAMLKVAELKLMFDGRAASRETVIGYLDAYSEKLEPWLRASIRTKYGVLQSTFVSDDAQSAFLQAKPKLRFKDWGGALTLLNQALSQDPGNLAVLREKSRCEKALRQWDKFVETTKAAYETDPFDSEVLENLLETYVYKGQFASILAAVKKDPDSFTLASNRLNYAVALMETDAVAESTLLFENLLEERKNTTVPPIVLYGLGRNLSKRKEKSLEAVQYWERFLSMMARPENLKEGEWDPYHLAEKSEEVKKSLSTLKSNMGGKS